MEINDVKIHQEMKEENIDHEWIVLLLEAKAIGISIVEIKNFLKSAENISEK